MASTIETLISDRISAGEEVTYDYVGSVITDTVSVWNNELPKIKHDIRNVMQESPHLDDIMNEMQPINLCKSPQANYIQAQRLCRRMGIRCATNSKPAKHLSYDHPEMAAVRNWVECSNTSHGVNLRLIANFDQVWTCLFEHKKKVLYKPPPKLDGESITQGILKATNFKDRAWYGDYFLSVIFVHIYIYIIYMCIYIYVYIYFYFFFKYLYIYIYMFFF